MVKIAVNQVFKVHFSVIFLPNDLNAVKDFFSLMRPELSSYFFLKKVVFIIRKVTPNKFKT